MLLPLQLFELQINAMKNYYFNNKKTQTKPNQQQNPPAENVYKIQRYAKYLLNTFFTAWSQTNIGTISKNTLLCLVIFYTVFDNP